MIYSVREYSSAEGTLHFSDLKLPKSGDLLIAEGDKLISRLLESRLEIVSFLMTNEHFAAKRSSIEARDQETPVEVILASKTEMEEIVGFHLHQGLMASARIPAEPTLESVIEQHKKPGLFVILDEIADAENMGAIYRTSLAMGAAAIIIDDKSVSPWIRRAVRVSMGAVFSIPTITVGSLPKAIELLKAKGFSVYATTINEHAVPLWSADLDGDVAFIFGSEGYGIKKHIIDASTASLTFPMPDGIDSLNVVIAEGIFLYEAAKQRARH